MKRAGLLEEDYEHINNKVNGRKIVRLADVADKIERVAFDVVRFRDSEGLDKLWVVEEKDGEKVLVAMYDDEIDKTASETKTASWDVVSDNKGGVNVYYKGEPIKRLAMSSLGLEDEEATSVSRYLPAKLASDQEFVRAFMKELSDTDRKAIYAKYPELKG